MCILPLAEEGLVTGRIGRESSSAVAARGLGKLTSSENIADVAGLAVAYDAYRLALGGKEGATVDGLTGDQQFFLAYAQSWRNKEREAAMRQRIVLDTHAPDDFRADTVRNLDAWYEAFKVSPTDKLALKAQARVKIW